jgi:DNA repair exonuclease SbcCD nuclease subunit
MPANLRRRLTYALTFLFLLLSILGTPVIGMGALQACAAAWKFAVISDTQGDNSERNNKSCINDAVVQAIAADIVHEDPDFVLVAGDLVNGWFRNGGTDYGVQYANWREAMKAVYEAGIRVYPIRGNHDSGPERLALPPLPSHLEPPPNTPALLKKAFRDAFPESYIPKNGPADEEGLTYSFTHKDAFIVGLDLYTGGQHKVNQDWLEGQLAGNRRLHVFVYGHEPAFETRHKDNLAFYPKERDYFWDSIGRAGARVYFCGHDHFYDRALISDNGGNQIRQIIAGAGGGTLRKWQGAYKDGERVQEEYRSSDHHGYVLVTIEGPRVTVAWRAMIREKNALMWRTLDSFAYYARMFCPINGTEWDRMGMGKAGGPSPWPVAPRFFKLPDESDNRR